MTIDPFDFVSSNLSRGEYARDSKTLTLTFAHGRPYIFNNVPPELWNDMKQAQSPGKFFRENIKDRF